MVKKRKALGLVLLATLAGAAVMANAAQAQFTSNKSHTIISGAQEGNHTIIAGPGFGGIVCTTVTFSGTMQSTSEASLVVTPTFSGCKDSFGRTVDIDNSSFTYTFTSGAGKGTMHISGSLRLTITSGGSVVCVVAVESPQTVNGITYDNLGGTSGVRLTHNTTNLKNTTSGGFFNCGLSDGRHTNGSFAGTTVMTGKDTAGVPAEIEVD